jgi:hypothetical protein
MTILLFVTLLYGPQTCKRQLANLFLFISANVAHEKKKEKKCCCPLVF